MEHKEHTFEVGQPLQAILTISSMSWTTISEPFAAEYQVMPGSNWLVEGMTHGTFRASKV